MKKKKKKKKQHYTGTKFVYKRWKKHSILAGDIMLKESPIIWSFLQESLGSWLSYDCLQRPEMQKISPLRKDWMNLKEFYETLKDIKVAKGLITLVLQWERWQIFPVPTE